MKRHQYVMLTRVTRCGVAAAVAWILASAAAAQGGPPPAPVRVDPVTEQSVADRRMVTGDLRAVRRSLVASRESGIVLDLLVEEGSRVEAGDTLARLDDERLHLQLAELRADREVAQALAEEREADLERLRNDEAMVRSSFEDQAAYLKELQDAEAATRIAEARLRQARRAIAAIDAREAMLNDRIEDAAVLAPYAGVVIATRTELGEWVAEGAPVVEMMATDAVEAWLNVPQALFDFVSSGDVEVTVRIDAGAKELSSTAVRVLPIVDDRARSFTVVVTLPNDEAALAPGMSVTAWVPAGAEGPQLTVSKAAVLRDDRGTFVYVARAMMEPGSPASPGAPESPGAPGAPGALTAAMPARIEILFPLGDRFVVRSGDLRAGDAAIVEGNERLFPTAPVIPAPAIEREAAAGGRP
jgi:RND family efflux transporter MFP subunit